MHRDNSCTQGQITLLNSGLTTVQYVQFIYTSPIHIKYQNDWKTLREIATTKTRNENWTIFVTYCKGVKNINFPTDMYTFFGSN